jgi:hypothetical protein
METCSTAGGDGRQHTHDLPRDVRVIGHARADIDGLRRQAAHRLGDRHGRVHTVAAGLAGAGGDDAAPAGLRAAINGFGTIAAFQNMREKMIDICEV